MNDMLNNRAEFANASNGAADRSIRNRSRTENSQLHQSGFTLVELLVVIALTSILFTIIFRPLVSSLQLSNRAATQTEGQAAARDLTAQLNSILSNAEYVQDQTPATSTVNLWLTDANGATFVVPSYFTMIEYVPPAHQLDQYAYSPGSGVPIDPTTGLPSYGATGFTPGQSGLAFPLVNGLVLGRIFYGLTDNKSVNGLYGQNGTPAKPYFNFYEWATSDSGLRTGNYSIKNHNTYTLYKAEVSTSISDPNNVGSFIPNLMLFHTGPDSSSQTDMTDGPILIHDPNFFYDNSLAGGNAPNAGDPKFWAVSGWKDLNGDGKVEIWENWRAVSSSLIRNDKVDLLSYQRDTITNIPTYDGANHPIYNVLATFKPAAVQNDPGVGTSVDNAGNEAPNATPANFTTQYDHWNSNYRVFIYRATGSGGDPTQTNPLNYYEGIIDPSTGLQKIVHVTGLAPGAPAPDPTTLPDVSGQLTNGIFTTKPAGDSIFSFNVSMNRGLIGFGYPSTTVVHLPASPYSPLPQRYSPDDVNNADAGFGALGVGSKRHLSLSAGLSTGTWGGGQLNPAGIYSPLNPASGIAPTVSIVPGTEQVFGPDQRPGIHYGHRIQYTRVASAAGFTGPNQYWINYTNNSNIPGGITASTPASLLAGYIQFDSQMDYAQQFNAGTLSVNAGTDVNTGQPAAGTHMLPIFKFDPSLGAINSSMPADPIEVYYNFQMNQPSDVVRVDYMSRTMMIFSLEMRLYDVGSGKPQVTRLTDKINVGNLQH